MQHQTAARETARTPAARRGTARAVAPPSGQGAALQAMADASPPVRRLRALGLPAAAASGVMQRMQAVLQRMEKPAVTNEKLQNIVNNLFKGAPSGGKKIGDGSAMAAANHEVKGGEKVGGRDHVLKLSTELNGLRNLKRKHFNRRSPVRLSVEDLATVNTLIDACEQAIAGTYVG